MGRERVHGGAAIWTRENFEPSRYSGFWKEISLISPCPSFLRYPEVHCCESQAGAQDQADYAAGTTARTCERRGLRRQAAEVGQGRGWREAAGRCTEAYQTMVADGRVRQLLSHPAIRQQGHC